ncbi:DUF6776 family protein [Alteromonas oceanisediminis]|uniref:DUF6776 family protein n=1 Tax=Alteromonas oceanisediminis TaxID=2836180 RepID=UPI001BDAF764|nr:DUF6776 family protein [Alteromonas oceanisediminis]MBT0585261.1 hypothetical protein [Alteromonas oceanisediminis]
MNLHELRSGLTRMRYTLLITLVMLVMTYFGYQLAQLHHQYLSEQLAVAETTVRNLSAENQTLIQTNNQLKAQYEIAELANEALDQRIQQGLLRERQLTEQVTFYQKVVAPELSEEGFSIDGVQVAETSSDDYFSLSMVLIQQTRVKATIKGELDIFLYGSLNGQPMEHRLTADNGLIGDLNFSFKYFQTLQVEFQLPAGFIPDRLQTSTSIYQYRKKRGDYEKSFAWSQIVNGIDERE